MHAYVGVVSSPVLRGERQRREVRAEDDSARAPTRSKRCTKSSAARRRSVTLGDKDAKDHHLHVQAGRVMADRRREPATSSASNLAPDLAPPIRQARHRVHRAAHRGRRHGHEHGLGPLGARLADHVRVEHVHVPREQVGGRDPLRAQPPADREHGRVPHHHPGGMDVVGRIAPLGPQARRSRRSAR